jgi:hypothetical protein
MRRNARAHRERESFEAPEAATPERPPLALASLATADPATRAATVARLQRGAGNRAVAAAIMRAPADTGVAETPELATEPHGGGDASGLIGLLQSAGQGLMDAVQGEAEELVIDTVIGAAGLGQDIAEGIGDFVEGARDFFGGGTEEARPEVPEPKPESDPVNDWLASKPTTNPEYAQWILDGKVHGFVVFHFSKSETQMTSLAAGEKVFAADPAQAEIFGSFKTISALVEAKAKKWQADRSKPKEALAVGSFLREGSSGHSGRAIDINRMDWTGADGPVQVEEALRALPAGKYGVGLPFQGEFFPIGEWLTVRKQNAQAAAGPGAQPEPITDASLEKFTTKRLTSSYVDGKWKDTPAGSSAVGRLKSVTLKAAITELNGAGYEIYVFPDNDNHIHIQNP